MSEGAYRIPSPFATPFAFCPIVRLSIDHCFASGKADREEARGLRRRQQWASTRSVDIGRRLAMASSASTGRASARRTQCIHPL